MRVKMTIAVAAFVALVLGLPASSYAHPRVTVGPGESIQAAIDAADPGTTIEIAPGTYTESLLIKKDGIELVGAGRKKTHLVPPAGPPTECVFAPAGICVNDADDPSHRVKDVEISHLSVKGFVFGIFYFATKNGEITRVIASDNEGYGIFVNNSTGTTIARNVTGNDGEAGIYVGDAPNADASVWKNVTYGSLFGIFIRDAAHGQVVENKAFSNCAGILFLNTDETTGDPPGEPVELEDWLAKHNNTTANNRGPELCGGDDEPPVSGIGIAVAGGIDIRLIDNGVFGNQPPVGSPIGGGIAVVASPEFATPKPSTGTKVGFNTVLGNTPDLFWDGGGSGNAFFGNDCLSSQPDGLCEDPDDGGKHEKHHRHHRS
jgi:hypothetical protein